MKMKKSLLLSILVAGPSLIASTPTLASYTGLRTVLEFASQPMAGGPRDVYRVYAEFTNPADRVNAWYGNQTNPMSIVNFVDDSALGSGFFQFGNPNHQTAPYSVTGSLEWDTFVTIGVRIGSEAPGGLDATTLSPGFPQFIVGNTFFQTDAAVFVPQSAPQGRADWRVTGNDTNLRVMLMQLTVMPGQHVRGTINVDGQFWNGTGYENFTALGQTFASIPAPGILTVFAVAAGVRGRSRRRV